MIHKSRMIVKWLQACGAIASVGVAMAAQGQNLQFVPVITTYAGGATANCATATDAFGDGCPATQAMLSSPHISDTDAAGNLYITDTTNNIVRRVDAVTGIITLFAGGATTVCSAKTDTVGDGCPATQATLDQPKGLRVDAFGNVVIADLDNDRIRSVNAQTGIITTIVGSGTRGSGIVTNGTAANAIKLYSPFDLAFDRSGNLYISDYYDNQVVLITAVNGAIVPATSHAYTLAGNGTAGYTGDNGTANLAEIYNPRGITVDASGNVFIADFQDSVVRRISSPFQNGTLNLAGAIITTYAGNGTDGYSGDNGLAINAAVAQPQGVTTDAAGNLYIAQYGAGFDYIRVVNPNTNIITTLAGIGTAGFSGDGGAAIAAKLYSPAGLNFDRFGRLYIADSTNNRMRLVLTQSLFPATAVGASSSVQNAVAQVAVATTPSSVGITAGSHDFSVGTMSGCTLNTAAAIGAKCSVPVTFSPVYPGRRTTAVAITDSASNTYLTGASGVGTAPQAAFTSAAIATIAGTGVAGNTGNNGPASLATVDAPRGISVDASGSLVFADSASNVIRRIDHTSGKITVLAGTGASGYSGDTKAATSATLNGPTDVVLDAAGNLYIADTGNNCIRYVSTATGIISTIAGTTTVGYTGDLGPATAATFKGPTGLALDIAGNVYVADTGNNVVRRFFPGGYIYTFAGTGTAGYAGDAGQASVAQLYAPAAVVLDGANNLYIADENNNVIRKVTALGVISTYAGMHGVTQNAGDGGLATAASLQTPSDVALDAAGDLYIAAGGQVRIVNVAGVISTIAGNGLTGAYSGEGGAATSATIPSPAMNLAVDGGANVYLSDTTGNLVFTISDGTPRTLSFGTQAPGSTSAAQSISLVNTGNTTLALTGLTVSSNFTLLSGSSTACTSTTSLVPGASCALSVEFSPATTAKGSITGNVVVTDNALNGTSVQQSVPLTGTAAVPANPTSTSISANPTSITYGNSLVATATVTGTALTGSVVFTVDGVAAGTVPVSSGQAALTITKLGAGKHTINGTYTNDTVNSTSSGSVAVTVQAAVLTVTANNASRAIGVANPAFTYAITGFVYSDTAAVVSGTATFATTATTTSPVGSYPITYSSSTLSAANYSFVYAGATLTVTAASYTLTLSPTTLTMPAGQVGTITVTLTPVGSYQGTVNFSCGAVPANVTCYFTTPSLTATGSQQILQTALTIASDNFNHLSNEHPSSSSAKNGDSHTKIFSLAGITLLMLLGLKKKRFRSITLLAILLISSVMGITSCANAGQAIAATGTSTITVTAGDGAGLKQTATLTLTLN